MTFERICLGTAEDKFFCDHYQDYGDGQKKFDIGQNAQSEYQAKHFSTTDHGNSEEGLLDLLDELAYLPRHTGKGNTSDMSAKARCLISQSHKQFNRFSTSKPHRTSKDRRYIPFPEEREGWNRIHMGGGKGAQHKKSEQSLNK